MSYGQFQSMGTQHETRPDTGEQRKDRDEFRVSDRQYNTLVIGSTTRLWKTVQHVSDRQYNTL